ncbi:MAG: hypothetical protein AAF127_10585 [Pseudomonadota bacterium]
MDPDLLLIFCFIIVVVAIVGASVNGIVKKVLDYKRTQTLPSQQSNNVEVTSVIERTDHIEDRLRVLERIVTDPEARGSAALADEIEQLRIEQEKSS